jgi:hypothetical protein
MATQYTQHAPGDSAFDDGREAETTLGLVRRLMDEVSTLFRQEIALATAEISRSLITFLTGVTAVAMGGAVLFAALLVLLASAVLGLANVVEPWLAALIVGVVVGIVGYVMVHIGKKSLDPTALKPDRSPDSLRKDKDVLTRKIS